MRNVAALSLLASLVCATAAFTEPRAFASILVAILGGISFAIQLLDKAEQGDLAAAREVIDRTDGKAVQAIDYGEVSVEQLTDAQLNAIAAGALIERELPALPPPRKLSN